MASGDTLCVWGANDAEFPTTNFGVPSKRNNHPTLLFDTTTQETVFFSGVLPRNYAGGGITAYIHWAAATATSGTIGWDVSFENLDEASFDIDADAFQTAQTVTAATVGSLSGYTSTTNVAITNGTNIDSIAVGNLFRVRIRRDTGNDNAGGDAELLAVELKET